MAKMPFTFSVEVFEAMLNSESNPDSAAQSLLVASQYLRRRELMPELLADFLADAFEAAMLKPQEFRNSALLRELRLTNGNARPVKADHEKVWRRFSDLMELGESQNGAASTVSFEFSISESTAVTIWKKYSKVVEEYERILRDEAD